MDTPGKRLKLAMMQAEIGSAAALARAAKLDPVTVRAYVRDDRAPPLNVCEALGAALNVDAKWIFSGRLSSEAPQLRRSNATSPVPIRPEKGLTQLPVYGDPIDGGHGRIDLSKGIVERVPAPLGLGDVPGAYGVFVVGDTMETRYFAGEIVYVHPSRPVKPGDFVFIQVAKKEGPGAHFDGYIKRLVSITDERIVCSQLNPQQTLEFPRSLVRSVHKIVLSGDG